MIIKINMQSEIPIYLQLRNEIVKGIGRGEFEPGESLPTVRQMTTDLGINTMTVSKAYQLLKTEGFLETDRRKGTTICYPTSSAPQDNRFDEKLTDELELLSAEAKFHGMTLADFLELCQRAFNEPEVLTFLPISQMLTLSILQPSAFPLPDLPGSRLPDSDCP